jgi:hypothetical protein
MRTIESRLNRLEQRHEANREVMITMYDGPPMTDAEMADYNRTRQPDQPFIFTLHIDHAMKDRIGEEPPRDALE